MVTYPPWFVRHGDAADKACALQNAPARTTALCQHDAGLRSLVTQVISVHPINALDDMTRALFKQARDDDCVVLVPQTIFYPQGGGQPSDMGTIRSTNTASQILFEVSTVRTTTQGQILHLGRFEPVGSQSFTAGDEVLLTIDGDKRDRNSQIHSAGHLLGLSVRHLAGRIPEVRELKAQHYPEAAFVDFQGLIQGHHKEAIQAQLDSFVQQALPVNVDWWEEAEVREKCTAVPENLQIPDGGLFRVVNIEGAGAYPCGGTHVGDTSQLSRVTLRKISRQKGITRLSYSTG